MPLHDLTEFLKLSSALNYNLSAASLNRYNVLLFIIGKNRLDTNDQKDRDKKSIVMEALSYLFNAYSNKRRRLGPMAVLHPLRAAALLARSVHDLNLIDLLSIMFHDILEDIRSTDFDPRKWQEMEHQLNSLMKRLVPEDECALVDRLLSLTRLSNETYYRYIGRMLNDAVESPKLVLIKLADRLDNTLDMRMDLQDPMEGIDFFENIFQLLFVNTYDGYDPENHHATSAPLNGARRLYQLFKNAVLLSLIRQKLPRQQSHQFDVLFRAVAEASLKEAQRNFIHGVGFHFTNREQQRKLLLETMEYCYSGRSNLVTKADERHMLDGLFSGYFGFSSKKILNQRLDNLYQNKPLMIESTIAFIVIFLSFLNDSQFYVRGISAEGIAPA
ncbi:MAG: hypothetical protein QNI92_06815 [Desulfobacterales bacterium]|nr:hypothetical protein [Desulfobacterales bacterium]MDJ0915142.1 hypothetical protein [Desulfobacterales bacterium]